MLFLSNDAKKTTHEVAHTGTGFYTRTLAARSKELTYLHEDALIGEFRGLNTFLDFLNTYAPKAMHSGSSDERGRTGGFNTFTSYKKAMDVYLHNPSEIRDFSEKDELLDGGEDSGKSVVYDLTGDYIDIDRYIEGVPEVFGQMTDGNPRARRVAIYVNLSWVWRVDQSTINARCARISRLVDWLESQQIRCSVVGISSTECGHLEIIIKDFDEPLDLNDVAIVSHADFLRRVIFRWDEYSPTWQSGYGSAYSFSDSVKKEVFQPQFNTEYSVFVDAKVDSPNAVNSDFDDLEELLADVLVDDNADEQKRSIAVCR